MAVDSSTTARKASAFHGWDWNTKLWTRWNSSLPEP